MCFNFPNSALSILLSGLLIALTAAQFSSNLNMHPWSSAMETIYGNSGKIYCLFPLIAKPVFDPLKSEGFIGNWWACFTVLILAGVSSAMVAWYSCGGCAWGILKKRNTIPGPRGLPILGSLFQMKGLAHRKLANLSQKYGAGSLMSLSLGFTRLIISSKPDIARELLNSSAFADRPLKQSAQQLLFGRAIGFAPYGDYWRNLRRIASTHLFSPRRIQAHESFRQSETSIMIQAIAEASQQKIDGSVQIRPFLQRASLNNVMSSVFGRRYGFESNSPEGQELQAMVREGFELLGAFNWADHLPALRILDPQGVMQRCAKLVPKVNSFVQNIIEQHRKKKSSSICGYGATGEMKAKKEKEKKMEDEEEGSFLDVLLSLQGEDKLADADMVAVLWEMIFRGTDTTAILMEWIMAEMVRNPAVQKRAQEEIDEVLKNGEILAESAIAKMPYVAAVVKETLRLHPPGPLLSWARLATQDTNLAGHFVPAGTTAMVNMWAICHDPEIWANPEEFVPERFLASKGGLDFDIRGSDLRLAPFGAGRRVCPGRNLGIATVHLWLAHLLHKFDWLPSQSNPPDLSETLKLSCEMIHPLHAIPIPRSIPSL